MTAARKYVYRRPRSSKGRGRGARQTSVVDILATAKNLAKSAHSSNGAHSGARAAPDKYRARYPRDSALPQPSDATYTLPNTADQMRRLLPWLALTYAQEKPYYEVVFAVLTVPQHRPHRDAIRNGYGQPGGFRTKLWFVVSERDPGFAGAGFVEERSKKDDLLVCDTEPGFDHIIGKVSCAIRKAVQLYDFDFFFKTDDDATLCIAQLVKDLRAAPKGASVYAGRRVKAGRALEAGKPLEVNLGLTTDPPHFGGHGYGVSYDVARFLSHPPAPLYHHLHEDTCFGNWVIGFDVKRLNLRAMTDHYYPNQKNLAGVSRLCGNHAIVYGDDVASMAWGERPPSASTPSCRRGFPRRSRPSGNGRARGSWPSATRTARPGTSTGRAAASSSSRVLFLWRSA